MELGVFERLILLNVLPKESDITSIKLIRKLREDLSFSEEEHKALQFKTEGGRMLWVADVVKPKEVAIGEKASDIIVSALKKLNNEKKLQEEHIPIYERFVKE